MTDTHIKIKPVTPRVQYTANGSTTVFPYSFAIFDETDMVVYVDDDIITTGYTVSGAGQTDGGNVVFYAAPASGKKITLLRNVPIERITDFQEGGTFRPKNINDELDRQTAFVQQVQEKLDRAVVVGPTSPVDPEAVLTQVQRVYNSIDNVDIVADDISNVNTVASNISKVQTTANNISSVNTVAGNISKVNTVAGISSNVTAVAGNTTNINAVAGNATNINAVNANKTNIDTVAGNSSNINTVATNISNVNNCATNMAAILDAPNQAASAAASAMLSAQYANDKINQTHISNCITEIPQDISLTLSSGTLTLKSGSKVYVPNGSGTFNTVTISEDISGGLPTEGSGKYFAVLQYGTSVKLIKTDSITSGTTEPTPTNGKWWYNTVNNVNVIMNVIKISGRYAWTNAEASFPFALVNSSDGISVSGVEQLFNGFGYLGSTVFILPGVKGLIPNGHNPDGTMKNNALNVTSVLTRTFSGYADIDIVLSNNYLGWNNVRYNEFSNKNYSINDGVAVDYCCCGRFTISSGIITSFNPKPVFHATDYNDAVKYTDFATAAATTNSSAGSRKPAVIVENYKNGTDWYRIWSDGWIEQGGVLNETTSGGGSIDETVNLLKSMSDSNYCVCVQPFRTSDVTYHPLYGGVVIRSTNQIRLWYEAANNQQWIDGLIWEVKGYGA